MPHHLFECSALSPDQIKEKQTFFEIGEDGNLCKNCWCLFDADGWVRHRKSQVCKTSKVITHRDLTLHNRSAPDPRPNHSLINKQASQQMQVLQVPAISESVGKEGTSLGDMIGIVNSIMTPLLKDWIGRHQHIDPAVLVTYLTSAVVDFGTAFIRRDVLVPTWTMI